MRGGVGVARGCLAAARLDAVVVDGLGHGALVVHNAAHGAHCATRCACAACALRFLVADRCGEVDAQVCFLDADGMAFAVVGFHAQHGNFVDGIVVAEGEDVAYCQT